MPFSLNRSFMCSHARTLTGANEVGLPREQLSSPKYTPIKQEGEKNKHLLKHDNVLHRFRAASRLTTPPFTPGTQNTALSEEIKLAEKN